MAEYHGWTIKAIWDKEPWLIPIFFRRTRKQAIRDFETKWREDYKKERRKGNYKVVKIKLVEVE